MDIVIDFWLPGLHRIGLPCLESLWYLCAALFPDRRIPFGCHNPVPRPRCQYRSDEDLARTAAARHLTQILTSLSVRCNSSGRRINGGLVIWILATMWCSQARLSTSCSGVGSG